VIRDSKVAFTLRPTSPVDGQRWRYDHAQGGPCNSFNCLGHFKNVCDDDDDDAQLVCGVSFEYHMTNYARVPGERH